MKSVGLGVLAALCVAVTACGGLGPAPLTYPPELACPQVLTLMGLVYPAPGSTGIPDAVNSIVVAGPIGTLTLQPATGAPVVTTSQAAVPSPIPSPNAAPPPGSVTEAFAVPTLASATTYTVIAQDTRVDNSTCPEFQPRTLGSFTTQ